MQLILLGYMGSGKTTIGKKLAEKLAVNFIDLDAYIETREAMSIANIFENKGEIYFRKIENHYLSELVNSDLNFVLSVGGGTPCYADNIELINQSATSIYLKTSVQELSRRLVKEKQHRPLIKNVDDTKLPEFIAKHLFERAAYYEKATLVVSTDQKDADQLIEEIMSNRL